MTCGETAGAVRAAFLHRACMNGAARSGGYASELEHEADAAGLVR